MVGTGVSWGGVNPSQYLNSEGGFKDMAAYQAWTAAGGFQANPQTVAQNPQQNYYNPPAPTAGYAVTHVLALQQAQVVANTVTPTLEGDVVQIFDNDGLRTAVPGGPLPKVSTGSRSPLLVVGVILAILLLWRH